MARYRLNVLNESDAVFTRAEFVELSDEAAIAIALQTFPGYRIELWERTRLVGTFTHPAIPVPAESYH